MSIEGKHAYRFAYLQSDQWKAVRLEALVREDATCQLCGKRSIDNDAHHIWYPKSFNDTTEKHLVVLCRSCHEFTHAMLPECKTGDEEYGREQWIKFRNAVQKWMIGHTPTKAKGLREAYERLKVRVQEINERGLPGTIEEQSDVVVHLIHKWAKAAIEAEHSKPPQEKTLPSSD